VRVPNNPLFPFGPSHEVDDVTDHPTFRVTVSDAIGQSNATGPRPDAAIRNLDLRLPASFRKLDASAVADIKLQSLLDDKAPGRAFFVRKNGNDWADACAGQARLTRIGVAGRAMTRDTIIHIASMSKPICATAIVAMIDDWTAIQAARSNPNAPTQVVRFDPGLRVRLGLRPSTVRRATVPAFLAPLFASRKLAKSFLDDGLLNGIPGNGAEILRAFATSTGITATPDQPTPPGHVGLLRRVLMAAPPPTLDSLFLPLVQRNIEDAARQVAGTALFGAGINGITLRQLLTHTSPIVNGINNNPALRNVPGWNEAQSDEPTDGSAATFHLWPYLLILLRQDANQGSVYKNDNYTILGGVVEACTETPYDDYVEKRLLFDDRFDRIRRRVVSQNSAYYYQGTRPFWTIGNPLPDYRGFSAAGGFYTTASQMTDWLHALFTRQDVNQVLGAAPLVTTSGFTLLFGAANKVFSGGNMPTVGTNITSYPHNGGTGVGTGSINGKMAIFRDPGGDIHTAFLAGNGSFDAEPPFNETIKALIQNAW
jgi:CubicO group peptidase (beta-lactamase class C family)